MGALSIAILLPWVAKLVHSSPHQPSFGQKPFPDSAGRPFSPPPSFFEGFDRLDPDRWFVSDGWNNGAWQGCTWSARNLQVAGGVLTLAIDDTPARERAYSCAEVQTRAVYGYGLYEARIRGAGGAGTNTAMFTYTGSRSGEPNDEIDFEFIGKSPTRIWTNYWRDGADHGQTAQLNADGTRAFVTYAFDWRADSLRYYVNGRLARVVGPDNLPRPAQKLILSLWIERGTTQAWLGRFAYPGRPVTAAIDWIAYTRPGERCRFPQSISCAPGYR
jgi:endo-1,3-1,4-beta-glycanase ExoK